MLSFRYIPETFKNYYIHYIKDYLKRDFPTAVSYNRFVELMPRVFFKMMLFMKLYAFGKCTGITFVDSTMIPVCHNVRRYFNKVFAGFAKNGKGTMGWCHGFKLHLLCNDSGEVITFCLTGANVDDRDSRGMDGVCKGFVWEGLCRQGIYQAGTLREPVRSRYPTRSWAQG